MKRSAIVKDVRKLAKRSKGVKLGLDLNTTSFESYVEYTKTTAKFDMFARGYGRVGLNDLNTWGDEDYQAGVKFGVSF